MTTTSIVVKSRATVQSFYKRKDRFWFEKLARNKDDKEVMSSSLYLTLLLALIQANSGSVR